MNSIRHPATEKSGVESTKTDAKKSNKVLELLSMRARASSIEKKSTEKKFDSKADKFERSSQVSSDKHTTSFPVPRMGIWKRAVKMSKAMGSLMKTEDGYDRPKAFANTYRLSPDSEKRFSPHRAQAIILDVLKSHLRDAEYDRSTSKNLSVKIADDTRAALKGEGWTRYKFLVYVVLGEQKGQGIECTSRCMWNLDSDDFATDSYINSQGLYAISTVYAVYFD